jgi:gamma-glutamyltranspeptidase/glutathione hydrolase
MDEILSPTIRYAEEVFQFRNWLLLEGSVSRYMKQPNVKETYTSDGKIPGKGDLFRNPF